MPICEGLLVSRGEKQVHQILEQYSDDFRTFAKVRFFDVIKWDTPGITPKEHEYLEKTHFDFVVCEPNEPYKPVFAVEFDGLGGNADEIDPYRELKKAAKMRISGTEGLPVIWLESRDVQNIFGETLLDYIIQYYIGDKWVEQLKAEGKAPADDGYVQIFRPLARLIYKMKFLRYNSISERNLLPDGWIEMKRKIEFETTTGMETVERSFRVRLSNFPHFPYAMWFADDVANYNCLLVLDQYLKEGKVV
jgi:hypothetical protein